MRAVLIAFLAMICAKSACAQVITGTLYDLRDVNSEVTGNTIDHIRFTANSDGPISIDALSWQAFDNFFDTRLFLFTDDGLLDSGDLITDNDDSFVEGFGDGTTSALDSYLAINLSAGDYLLAVDSCCHTVEEAVQGFNTHGPGHLGSLGIGHYQLTFGGDVTIIPEPTSVALVLTGLCFVSLRRRV